jgi:hypothetical protein
MEDESLPCVSLSLSDESERSELTIGTDQPPKPTQQQQMQMQQKQQQQLKQQQQKPAPSPPVLNGASATSPNKPNSARKDRFAAKSFESGGVNLGGVRKTPALPTVVDIKSLCSLETDFDEDANKERMLKMKKWQNDRKQTGASKVLKNYILSFCIRRRYIKFHAAVNSMQTQFRRFHAVSRYSAVLRAVRLTQRHVRGYWVRRSVQQMRLLALRLGKLRVVYNMKVRRSKRRGKAAIVIQCVCRRKRAQGQLVQRYEMWAQCNEATVSRHIIITREVDRKTAVLNSFIKTNFIRATLWFSLVLVLLNGAAFYYSFSDNGMSPRLKETDQRYIEGRLGATGLVYYPDSTTGDAMLYSSLTAWDVSSVGAEITELLASETLLTAPLSKSTLDALWCGGKQTSLAAASASALPSWTLSKFYFLSHLASGAAAMLAIVSSLLVSRMMYGKKTAIATGMCTLNSWGTIRAEKDDILKYHVDAVSTRVVFYSMLMLVGSWVGLSIAVAAWVLTSRYHYYWFVLPYATDVCSNSLALQNIFNAPADVFLAPLLNALANQSHAHLAIGEYILLGLLAIIFVRLVWSFMTLGGKIEIGSGLAQREMAAFTARIDAVVKYF